MIPYDGSFGTKAVFVIVNHLVSTMAERHDVDNRGPSSRCIFGKGCWGAKEGKAEHKCRLGGGFSILGFH